jgi:hypothetical protein
MTTATPDQVFAIDLAQLAREVAMDIFPLADVLKLHQLTDEDWLQVQENPRFKAMVEQMVREWNSAASTRERVKIKAATGLESQLETLIRGLSDEAIPYTQRVEGAKFLARIGEIEGSFSGEGGASPFAININIGSLPPVLAQARVLDARPVIPESE